jgi:hypothetical protein
VHEPFSVPVQTERGKKGACKLNRREEQEEEKNSQKTFPTRARDKETLS